MGLKESIANLVRLRALGLTLRWYILIATVVPAVSARITRLIEL